MMFGLRGVLRTGVAGIALLAVASTAGAAGFQLREQSAEGVGNSFAGSAAKAYDPSTVWYNPAGMTLLQGHQIAGSSAWIAPQARFSGTGTSVGNAANTNGGGDGIADALMGAMYGVYSYDKNLKFGLAVTSPFGLRTKYPTDWAGRYFGIESSITNIQFNPNVAYRINNNLSIGAGLDVSWLEATLSGAFNQKLTGGTVDALLTNKGNAFGFGANAGLLYEFSPTSRVGLTYRTAIHHTLSGDVTNTGSGAFLAAKPSGSIRAAVTLPQQAGVSFYHEIDPKWAVMADAQWTGWSSMKDITIDYANGSQVNATQEHWRDTWFFSVGANYKMVPGHTLHLGAAYDQGVVRSADLRTPRLPDSDRFWLSTGYTWDINKNVQWNLGYAHIFVKEADTNLNDATYHNTLVGNYTGSVDMISTSFSYKF